MEKKTVLIIEDGVVLQDSFKRLMSKKINLLQAFTCREAKEIFDKNQEKIDIIAFDWNIKSEWTTLDLIKEIKTKFNWTMIAMSNDDFLRNEQMEAWCDIELDDKANLLTAIYNLYKLNICAVKQVLLG